MKFLFFSYIFVFFFVNISFSEDIPLLKRINAEKKTSFEFYKIKNKSFKKNYFSFEIMINDRLVICHLPKTKKTLKVICH
tara:strand:+ start:416 stop:655 length:240 start_codon:yes stop_codon:yes gene_type:complete